MDAAASRPAKRRSGGARAARLAADRTVAAAPAPCLRLALVLLGPPGAGKGTQGRKIDEMFGYPRVSTGDMLRDAVSKGTQLGLKARRFLESGGLVPDSLVDAMVRARLRRQDCARGFVLDGYPRTIHQAEFLATLLPAESVRTVAIGIDVPDDVLVARLAGRRTCTNCGKIFNSALDGSRVGKRCDECGGTLALRSDDAPAVVRERLQVYHDQTEPLIRFYRRRRCFVRVDGARAVDAITRSLKRTIDRQQEMAGSCCGRG